MQVIISHVNTDFDALASMIAAKKLYPNAHVVISNQQSIPVRQYLTIYRDMIDLVPDHLIEWSEVTELILVDVASLSRIGNYSNQLDKENLIITVYDHHPRSIENVNSDYEVIGQVGAAVTLLIEEIIKRNISISSFEATLFGLGIYTDTGSFTYQNTTSKDLQAASFLMDKGMNLEIIQRFSDQRLLPKQQELLNELFIESTTYKTDGLQIVVSSCQCDKFQKGLSILTEKLLEITGADAVLTVVGMKKHIYIVGRATSDRITLQPLLKRWGGGGHKQAGSATVKNADRVSVWNEVINHLELIIKPAITAKQMMTAPVKTILPETTIEEAGRLMYRYGHSGYPVVDGNKLLGMITRRDLDKANHHGLGHAPVKAYMSTNVISMERETPLEEIQKLIIEHNIGRLPVVDNGKLVGIVTRTNIIEVMHNQKLAEEVRKPTARDIQKNLQEKMKQQLPKQIYSLLKDISKAADYSCISVYLIGGIVRDIFLGKPNDDIDLVVEGDGIAFSKKLQEEYGGEVIVHENFKTATWKYSTKLEIDITSSRLEYYERPASLPDVETSTLKEDLYRRDFTMNAMAICLNSEVFGQVVDPFRGQVDLQNKRIKILHNLSFVEDPTRIFRAVRFETRFKFFMDTQTEKLAIHSIEKVKDLSANRIIDEMKRLFKEDDRSRIMKRLFELQFWQQFGVEGDKVEQSCAHAQQLEKIYAKSKLYHTTVKPSWFNYFLIPFYYEGNLKAAKKFSLTKTDTKFLQEVVDLKGNQDWRRVKVIGEFQRYLKTHSDEAILFSITNNTFTNKHLVLHYLQKRKHLPTYLTGKDLIEQGMQPSASFSTLLLELEIAILNDEVKSKADALLWLQKQIPTS